MTNPAAFSPRPIVNDEPRDARGRRLRDPAPVFAEPDPEGACGPCGHLDEDHGPRGCRVVGCRCGRRGGAR